MAEQQTDWFASNAPQAAASQDWFASNQPTFKTQNEPPSASMWEKANTPLIPQIQQAADAISDFISRPNLGDQALNDRLPGLGTLSAMIRGGAAGAVQGAGTVLSGFTSPVGLVLSLTGLGPDSAAIKQLPAARVLLRLPAVQAAQRAIQAAGGAAFAGHGAERVVTDDTLAGKAQGVVEMAGGALGMASALPKPRVPRMANAVPEEAAAVQAGLSAGVPVDLATATGNKAVRGVQFLADRSLGGSLVAGPAEQKAATAFKGWGDKLASESAGATTAEQAGQSVRDALTARAKGHNDAATKAYDTLRALEEHPTNRMNMPVKPDPVAGLQTWQVAELRRMVHELDANEYKPRTWEDRTSDPGKKGNAGGGDYEIHAGSGGAKVFHDITQISGTEPTRAVLQAQLEVFLGGGPITPHVRAALEVAELRNHGKWGRVSKPEHGPGDFAIPTRLESQRVTSQDMGLPVDLSGPKKALRPLYDQMMRQMPITQQQASPGLKAIENILNGPDYGPLSQIDTDLSAIKAVARQHGGLAKMAVMKLDAAVREAAANGGPEVMRALHEGRQATIAKYGTEGLIDALPGGKMEEPVAVFKAVTAPKDAGIELLRTVKAEVPQALPQIARAKLEDLLSLSPDKSFAEWQKLGTETRGVLFPKAGHAQALDHFFLLQKKMATNPNPSGTAPTAALFGQVLAFWSNPVASIIGQSGAAGLSAMLHSPAVTRALTQAVSVSRRPAASAAVRAAALASLSREVQRAGLPALVPQVGQADERPVK